MGGSVTVPAGSPVGIPVMGGSPVGMPVMGGVTENEIQLTSIQKVILKS